MIVSVQSAADKATKLVRLANVRSNDSPGERDTALNAALGVIEKYKLVVGNSGIQPTVGSAQYLAFKWAFWVLSEFGSMSRAWLDYYLRHYGVFMNARELDHLLEAMVSIGFLFGKDELICVDY